MSVKHDETILLQMALFELNWISKINNEIDGVFGECCKEYSSYLETDL